MRKAFSSARFAGAALFVFTIATPSWITSRPLLPQAVANGRHIFAQSCSTCHDIVGTSTKSAPRLKGFNRRRPRPADADVRKIIHQGKGKMPAFSTLSELQIDELIAYLRTL